MNKQVLVIEDNEDIARLIKLQLSDLNCNVKLVFDGTRGAEEIAAKTYDLLILDVMLPGVDGMEILRRVRARPDYMPVLMLTAKSSELDRVLGLEMGADDYLTKPFSVLELCARVKAIFRRVTAMGSAQASDSALVRRGELSLDPERREVQVAGRSVDLTAKEFDLLLYFARSPGRVHTREQLLSQVWGYSHSGYEHTVNSHINRLRAKIERNPNEPEYIQTVWGVGYKFAGSGKGEAA
ncbi:MAG: response regulator transcription factor [Rhodocyclaceae bacterium]|nr:response regulator transcription factor [Rhodocyclaceae bacterium]MBX3667473.1 response regulator transcription factor [Rhodocyclaceae bacterium]